MREIFGTCCVSNGDFFSLWKSDQVVLRILKKLQQCWMPHLLFILFSYVLVLMLNLVVTFGFTYSLFNFNGVVAANLFLQILFWSKKLAAFDLDLRFAVFCLFFVLRLLFDFPNTSELFRAEHRGNVYHLFFGSTQAFAVLL